VFVAHTNVRCAGPTVEQVEADRPQDQDDDEGGSGEGSAVLQVPGHIRARSLVLLQ